jgi:hypothetical protein
MKLPGGLKSVKSIYLKIVIVLILVLFLLTIADNLNLPWNNSYDLIGVSIIRGKNMTPEQKSMVKTRQSDENYYLVTSGLRETLTGSKIKVINNPDLIRTGWSNPEANLAFNRQTGFSYFFCNDFISNRRIYYRFRYSSGNLEKTTLQFSDSYSPQNINLSLPPKSQKTSIYAA